MFEYLKYKKEKINFPVYDLNVHNEPESSLVDRNRTDTVKPMNIEDKNEKEKNA